MSDNNSGGRIHDVRLVHRGGDTWPESLWVWQGGTAIILQPCAQNRASIAAANGPRDDSNKNGDGFMNEKKPDWLAREREEIAARVAHFRATQKKFEKERAEYYAATLSNAWDGFNKPVFWN